LPISAHLLHRIVGLAAQRHGTGIEQVRDHRYIVESGRSKPITWWQRHGEIPPA
jgi:hypothetical protein